jgi:hypothetical protein
VAIKIFILGLGDSAKILPTPPGEFTQFYHLLSCKFANSNNLLLKVYDSDDQSYSYSVFSKTTDSEGLFSLYDLQHLKDLTQ